MDELKNFTFYSGGARGADTLWKQSVESFGASCIEYTPAFYDSLPQNITDVLETQYIEVVHRLKRHTLPVDTYAGKLVRRDMIQANKAKSVYAIAIIDPHNGLVKGGTGYCTTRAILRHIPIYVFDQDQSQWFTYSYEEERYIPYYATPILINKSTLVGSRDITESGIKAMNDCLTETISSLSQ